MPENHSLSFLGGYMRREHHLLANGRNTRLDAYIVINVMC